jgi:hypothetical protein
MDASRLSKSVRQILLLKPDASGSLVPTTLFDRSARDRPKKKGSRLLRPMERAFRYMADATATTAGVYAQRHRESNRKRKDGWLCDINRNVMRASQKGARRVKIYRLMSF